MFSISQSIFIYIRQPEPIVARPIHKKEKSGLQITSKIAYKRRFLIPVHVSLQSFTQMNEQHFITSDNRQARDKPTVGHRQKRNLPAEVKKRQIIDKQVL